jgi:hypothetical protein
MNAPVRLGAQVWPPRWLAPLVCRITTRSESLNRKLLSATNAGSLSSPGKQRGYDSRGYESKPTKNLRYFRRQLGTFMESHMVQRVICALILVDSLIVLMECVVDAVTDDRKDRQGTWVHAAFILSHMLEWANTAFLSAFVLELLLLVAAFGLQFFTHFIYVMDLAVVLSSLWADYFTHMLGRKGEHSFVLLLRVWRVLRVAHGVFMVMEERARSLKEEMANLRGENARLRKQVQQADALLCSATQDQATLGIGGSCGGYGVGGGDRGGGASTVGAGTGVGQRRRQSIQPMPLQLRIPSADEEVLSEEYSAQYSLLSPSKHV